MEHQEPLEAGAVVGHLPDPLEHEVYDLLADSVVTPGVVVGGVLLSINELLGMVELTVSSNSGLVNDSWLQVYKDCSWNMMATSGLREEGLEGVVPEGLVGGHVAVGLDAMFEAVEFPAGVSDLATGLADVDGDALTLGKS